VTDDPGNPTAFEDYPLTRSEYLSTMSHFYRGEIGRADAWRARLDPTTNWAVVTAGGMLSIAFAGPDHSHVTLLLAILLVSVFLGFEARRFRYFDVWRSRVRMLEENFFIPIIRRNLVSPRENWREFVAQDLDHPKFKITFLDAVGIRLRYNYIWIYLAILLAWVTKLYMHPVPAEVAGDLMTRMRLGPLHGGFVLGSVAAFYLAAVWLAVRGDPRRVSADEVSGVEREMDHWKT
jgi:uncharacterized membrane protein